MTQVSGPLSVVTESPAVLRVHNGRVGASSPIYPGRNQ